MDTLAADLQSRLFPSHAPTHAHTPHGVYWCTCFLPPFLHQPLSLLLSVYLSPMFLRTGNTFTLACFVLPVQQAKHPTRHSWWTNTYAHTRVLCVCQVRIVGSRPVGRSVRLPPTVTDVTQANTSDSASLTGTRLTNPQTACHVNACNGLTIDCTKKFFDPTTQ